MIVRGWEKKGFGSDSWWVQGFFVGWRKILELDDGVHSLMNILKTIKVYTLKWWLLCVWIISQFFKKPYTYTKMRRTGSLRKLARRRERDKVESAAEDDHDMERGVCVHMCVHVCAHVCVRTRIHLTHLHFTGNSSYLKQPTPWPGWLTELCQQGDMIRNLNHEPGSFTFITCKTNQANSFLLRKGDPGPQSGRDFSQVAEVGLGLNLR